MELFFIVSIQGTGVTSVQREAEAQAKAGWSAVAVASTLFWRFWPLEIGAVIHSFRDLPPNLSGLHEQMVSRRRECVQ
jgi:hypothetical protein